MGIYLPNMEMPGSCSRCFCMATCRLWKNIMHPEFNRHRNCPLAHVPPHGRLGDLDELKERATKRLYASNHGSMAEAYYAATIDLIDSAPTILPAEEERV